MTPKNISALALLVFVLASVLYLVFDERDRTNAGIDAVEESVSTNTGSPSAHDAAPPGRDNAYTVTAYYFHGTKRCKTCLAIESYSRESLEGGFPDAMRSGKLAWRPVNVDEPRNEHFVEEYALATKTVVLVAERGGERTKWKKLDAVWDLVGDKQSFLEYVRRETARFMEE